MKVKAASLVLDMNLYPRHHMDEQCITDYVSAMRAGSKFPPIIVDKKSLRVVDGWKRTTATLRFGGDNAEIEIEDRTYSNERAILLDAIRLNAEHGERLTHYDLRRCIILCERLRIKTEDVAEALHLTLERVAKISEKEIHRDADGKAVAASKQASVYLIQQEKPLTDRQGLAVKGIIGLRQTAIINQVITLIDGRLLNKKDERVMAAAEKLYGLLVGLFGEKKGAAA